VSSFGSDFNYDSHVSFTKDQIGQGRIEYDSGTITADPRYLSEELPGVSVFAVGEGGKLFLTYSTFARGLDMLLTANHYLDLTPEGRNEKAYPAWPRRHDEYPPAKTDPSVTSAGSRPGDVPRASYARDLALWAKTERVLGIWREELTAKAERRDALARVGEPANVVELERRLQAAEETAVENLKRPELAELREQAHQEQWGMEVDRLRQRLRAQETNEAEVRRLQDRVLQLSRELMGYRPCASGELSRVLAA
jgi:hypothetical protein